MKRSIVILALGFAATSLAACGGGGGSTGGGVLPGATPVPPIVTPAPTPTPTLTYTGKVVQLAGPLSAGYAGTRGPASTPQDGSAIAGATVYIASQTNVLTNGVPASPVAVATTAPDGSFTAKVPYSNFSASLAAVAVYGTTISPTTGTTDKGYTVAHVALPGLTASVTTANVTLYIDTLTSDEQSAFTALNADRSQANLAPVTADTLAQAAARVITAQMVGLSQCGLPSQASSVFGNIGGYGPTALWSDVAGPNWAAIVNYQSPWNSQTVPYAGLAAQYSATPCGTGFVGNVNYFSGVYVL